MQDPWGPGWVSKEIILQGSLYAPGLCICRCHKDINSLLRALGLVLSESLIPNAGMVSVVNGFNVISSSIFLPVSVVVVVVEQQWFVKCNNVELKAHAMFKLRKISDLTEWF